MNATQEVLARKFAAVVERFCLFVEQGMPQDKAEMVVQIARLLTELYSAALDLPDIETDEKGVHVQSIDIPLEQWEAKQRCIGQILGESNLYWEVFNPYHLEEPVSQTLGDDIADLYLDVKAGLLLMERGSSTDVHEAVRQWKEGFVYHWGDHLVDALRVLHRCICSQNDIQ
jgi:hypothetical protein